MAKKKAEAKKAKPAANRKAKAPNRAGSKPSAPQTAKSKAGDRSRVTNHEMALTETEEIEKTPNAMTSPVRAPEAPPLYDADVAAYESAEANEDVSAQRGALQTTYPRLPQVPTTLVRRNRHGVVQCQCTVGPDGIIYRGQRYRSLSGAASAASKDLGLNPVVNGYVFFHLAKPAGCRRRSRAFKASRQSL